MVASRTAAWSLAVNKLESNIFHEQLDLDLKKLVTVEKPARKKTFWDKLLHREIPLKKVEEEVFEDFARINGFDTELAIWGRPFFIVADSSEQAVNDFDAYMKLAGDDVNAIDKLSLSMIQRVEKKKEEGKIELVPAYQEIVDKIYPLVDHLKVDFSEFTLDRATQKRILEAHVDRLREAYQNRHSTEIIIYDDGDEYTPLEYITDSIFTIFNLAAQCLPGWMGRGYVWPTAMFAEIGVSTGQIFETAEHLFSDLICEIPEIANDLKPTIVCNYVLGGYVRPENVSQLKSLLIENREALITAWLDQKSGYTEQELDELAVDYKKILEPVLYAEKHGYGFIEVAEVYSGIMGDVN